MLRIFGLQLMLKVKEDVHGYMQNSRQPSFQTQLSPDWLLMLFVVATQ